MAASSNQREKSVAQAESHIRQAEKDLKTSMTKWSPDFDSAADNYSKAATCYKVGKQFEDCIKANEKACECYKEGKCLYHAAKSLENAVMICKDANCFHKIGEFAQRGALLYRQHGSSESAAQLLDKSGKILESASKFAAALDLYTKASETVLVEGRSVEASEYMLRVGRIQCQMGEFEKSYHSLVSCLQLISEEGRSDGDSSNVMAGRIVLSAVILQTHMNDVVEANKIFQTYGSYCDHDQHVTCRQLFESNPSDHEMRVTALSNQSFQNLDVQFQRLARQMKEKHESDLKKIASDEIVAKKSGEEMENNQSEPDDNLGLC